jgi:pimeloyl-ACP methyl ester carboxylesterase
VIAPVGRVSADGPKFDRSDTINSVIASTSQVSPTAVVFQPRMIFELDGMQLHYDVHGDGEPLLWLHGGMGHGPDWRYIFTSPPPGFRLIAPDLRGHGRSTGARATYSFRESALDVFALLDQLKVARVKAIGLSGGGITALHMGVIQPMRVQAMVVVSAPAVFPPQARAIQRVYSEAMLSEAERVRMRERHRRGGQLELLFAQVHAFADGDDPNFSTADLATITADTLIVFGDRDPLYPVSLACDLRAAIPNSYLWVVPNGGHGPVFGAAAPRFAETAMAFLRGEWKTHPT